MFKEKVNNLKPSGYNRYITKNECNLVFNSCSLSLIRLDDDKFSLLRNGKLCSFDETELQKLYEMNFINSYADESASIVEQHFTAEHKNNNFRLTVFTTTHCNARCSYCFQNGTKRINPTKDIESDIIKLLLKNKDKKIHIKWFGGEPLLNVDMIDRISNQLAHLGVDFSSSMISNGYLANKYIDKIANWKLKRIQITLDGINDKYNSIKNYVFTNDANPFQTVILGIKKLLEAGVSVSIRLNFDKSNYTDIIECIDYLKQEIGTPKTFSVYCHNIFGPERNYHLEDGTNIYLIIMKKLMECGYINNLFQLGVRFRPLPCSAYSPYFYVVDAQGKLLKCEHYISDDSYAGIVGDLKNGITNQKNLDFWLDREYPYDKCKTCDVLPICQGGCRFESLGGLENGACLPYRDCLDDLLFEYYMQKSLKNMGNKN
ncbi:MAG: radical SAM protein [Clostridia bacterium]|nr:radical SAM protein [Clostridia bacterium]